MADSERRERPMTSGATTKGAKVRATLRALRCHSLIEDLTEWPSHPQPPLET